MTLFQLPQPIVPRCPDCRSPHVVPIVYGLPSPQLFAAARYGHVALGGCVVTQSSPEWSCRVCGRRFKGDYDGPTWS
jgi:hypothetical protein